MTPSQDHSLTVTTAGAVWPPGCNGDGTSAPHGQRGRTGCLHHYPRGRNLAAEGCICPAWFDFDGWHLINRNEACTAHRANAPECSRHGCGQPVLTPVTDEDDPRGRQWCSPECLESDAERAGGAFADIEYSAESD